jgi:hypothetical protein
MSRRKTPHKPPTISVQTARLSRALFLPNRPASRGLFYWLKGISMTDNIRGGPLPDLGTLEIMADWKQDIRKRFERAQLRYELIGGNGPEIEALGDEMRDFSRVAQVLKGVISS